MPLTRSSPGTAFGVALLVLAAIGVLGYRNTRELDHHFDWVEHTYETRAQLQELSVSQLAVETARRGYSITGDAPELARFEEALKRGRIALASVHGATSDNPSQQARLDELEPLVNARMDELAGLVAARKNGLDSTAEQRSTRDGTPRSEAIQGAIRVLENEESRLLERRAADVHRGNRRTSLAIALGTLVGLGILIAVYRVLHGEIAARARGEARLHEWGRIFEHARWGIATATIDGAALTLVNPAFAKMHGIKGHENELHGRALVDLLVPEDRATTLDALARARAEGHSAIESSHVASDGSKRTFAVDIARLDGDAASPPSLVINAQDITERRDAQRERDRFFELSVDLIAVANLDGSFLRVNPSFESVLGYTSAEITSRPFIDFVHPDDVEATIKENTQLAAGEGTLGFENRYRCKDGTYRWLEWRVARDLQNRLLFAVARDTTATKAASAEIAALNVQLEQRIQAVTVVNAELETFSYSVSHDLRSPLRGIDGFSQALLEDYGSVLDAAAVGYLDRIRAATQRMGRLIDDLLQLSKITRANLHRQPTDVSALARSIVSRLRDAEPARDVTIEVAADLHASADPRLLEIALENLLANAWKFTSKVEHPRIEVGGLETAEGARGFFVKDNGAGFDMIYADKLFGAFQRLHAVTEFSGTGIGLATVRRIVSRHDGRVWADSRAGEGASFFITL